MLVVCGLMLRFVLYKLGVDVVCCLDVVYLGLVIYFGLGLFACLGTYVVGFGVLFVVLSWFCLFTCWCLLLALVVVWLVGILLLMFWV